MVQLMWLSIFRIEQIKLENGQLPFTTGTAVAQWLRCCATNRNWNFSLT